MGPESNHITGTLIWYVAICSRQAWLMAHAIEPYHDHELLALGRLLAESAYPRERKELSLPGMKVDVLRRRTADLDEEEAFVIGEVKRSPRAQHAQRLQLGYYLLRLREAGLHVRGELRYPEQRRVEPVELTPELEADVRQAIAQVQALLALPTPPPPVRIPACTNCAYYEFCWIAEEPSPPSAGPRRRAGQTSRSGEHHV
ncbi:MAG: CRISPR-associated protein Cas4 [Thermomicrobium sp.]